MGNSVRITGKNLDGTEREYLFQLMSAYDGVRLFHEYLKQLFKLMSQAGDLFQEDKETGSVYFDVSAGMTMLKEILPWEKIEDLAKSLLKDCTIYAGGKEFKNEDPSGIGDFFQGKPRELYTALFYGLCANFPDELDPFLKALGIDVGRENLNPST